MPESSSDHPSTPGDGSLASTAGGPRPATAAGGDGRASTVEVSVVLPAYDEERTIENTVTVTRQTLSSFLPAGSFEVIVAEDGCSDRTPEIADRLAGTHDAVRHVHAEERLGRGGALCRAFSAAHGDTLVYFDTDLATDMRHLEELVTAVHSGEYDVATGSRWMPGNVADRPLRRDVASRGYNALVRLFLRSDVQDHQCGFKAFDREALFALLDDVEDDHWFWDTEVLVRAQRRGYRVKEFPVDWEPKGDTTVDLVRDVLEMGSQILRRWWEFSVQPRITRRATMAVGSVLLVVVALLATQFVDPSGVVAAIRGADPAFVALAAVVYLFSWPLRGMRYRDILSELGYREHLGVLTGAVFVSQAGNLVVPGRVGDAVRAYVVKARRGVPYTTGFASLAVERVFDLLTITALAAAVVVGLAVGGSIPGSAEALPAARRAGGRTALLVASVIGVASVLSVAALAVALRSDRAITRRVLGACLPGTWADRLARVVGRVLADVERLASDRMTVGRVGATSGVIWSLDVLTALVVLAGFGVAILDPVLIAVGVVAVSTGNLAKVLPLSPGGVGLYEAAFTVVVVGATPIGWEVAIAAAILDHTLKNLVTMAGGLAAAAVLNVSLGTAVEEGAANRPTVHADD